MFQSHVFKETKLGKIEKEMSVVSREQTVDLLLNVINDLWFRATDRNWQQSWVNYSITLIQVTWHCWCASWNWFGYCFDPSLYADPYVELLFESWCFQIHFNELLYICNYVNIWMKSLGMGLFRLFYYHTGENCNSDHLKWQHVLTKALTSYTV